MGTLRNQPYLNEQDYLTFELSSQVRHEYIDGQIYAMAGAGENHNRICVNIGFHLRSAARGGSCGVFLNDMKLHIVQNKAYYYPDVMLGCSQDANDNAYYKHQPCFIAEVLSMSTATTDRREKLLAYQKITSLKYYLMVSSQQPKVEYFIRNDQFGWQTALLEEGEVLTIDCDNYHATLTLQDIYEDVVFV